ncbi:MAG: Hpt domain-containing protein [Candidatus Gallimonas sp.]
MGIEECYEKMGGNYEEVFGRLPSLSLVERFIAKFLEDDSFQTLCRQAECGNRAEAFLAAHTLKGVSGNLGFTALYESAAQLTEELRGAGCVGEKAISLLDDVKRDYALTTSAISEYLNHK